MPSAWVTMATPQVPQLPSTIARRRHGVLYLMKARWSGHFGSDHSTLWQRPMVVPTAMRHRSTMRLWMTAYGAAVGRHMSTPDLQDPIVGMWGPIAGLGRSVLALWMLVRMCRRQPLWLPHHLRHHV